MKRSNIAEKICALILISTFLPQIYAPYLAIGLAFLYIFITRRQLRGKTWLVFMAVLLIWVSISSGYNLFSNDQADPWGFLLWSGTFLFPLFVMIAFSTLKPSVKRNYLINLYLVIILCEFIIIVITGVFRRSFLLADAAKGTCRDSHILGLHFALGIIILTNKIAFGTFSSSRSKRKHLLYLLILWVGLIMTESASQLGLLIITLVLFYFFEFIMKKRYKRKHLVTAVGVVIITIFLMTSTSLPKKLSGKNISISRFHSIIGGLRNIDNIQATKIGAKFYSYRIMLTDIPQYVNFILGTGPATYTSRAAQIRMPEIAVHRLPFEIPQYRSRVFDKFISPIYYVGDKNFFTASWGTFSSPMTAVISVCVELGIVGAIIFMLFFLTLFKRSKSLLRKAFKQKDYQEVVYLKGQQYAIVFFILDLFYLNYWEYPEITIPVLGLMSCLVAVRQRIVHIAVGS